jgi:hypothetical protein
MGTEGLLKTEDASRRHFIRVLGGGVTASWLSSRWTAIADAQQHVQHALAQGSPPALQFFSTAQAEQVDAIAAQIGEGQPLIRVATRPRLHEGGWRCQTKTRRSSVVS